MTRTDSAPGVPVVTHVADLYSCYPGEQVTFFTQLALRQTVNGLTVQVWLPPELDPILVRCLAPAGFDKARLTVAPTNGSPSTRAANHLLGVWWRQRESEVLLPGEYEFQVTTQVKAPTRTGLKLPDGGSRQAGVRLSPCGDLELVSWAEMTDAAETISASSYLVRLQLLGKSKRLKYLPGLYQKPEHALMWRYLMTFDRVWDQYEELLTNQAAYFDPHLTPWYFKLWLAEWVGCWQYQHLPAALERQLLPSLIPKMVRFHQKRGTVEGLVDYLAFWLGLPADDDDKSKAIRNQHIKIDETEPGNFVVGDKTRLGTKLILGDTQLNICRFRVRLAWPAGSEPLSQAFLREVIDAWKPAHTTYELEID